MRKLSDEQVEEIKRLLAEKRMIQSAIARKYGVSRTIINQISMDLYKPKAIKKKYPAPPKETPGQSSARKLTFEDAQHIRKLNAEGTSKKQLSRQFNVSESTIKAIIDGRRYTK